MIDRENRNRLAESCRHYWSCLIDNMEFDEINFDIKSGDKGVTEIILQLWFLYDDIRTHKNMGKWEMEKPDETILKRTILFLKSDVEYNWPENPSLMEKLRTYLRKLFNREVEEKSTDSEIEGDYNYWPFLNKEEYDITLKSPRFLTNIS